MRGVLIIGITILIYFLLASYFIFLTNMNSCLIIRVVHSWHFWAILIIPIIFFLLFTLPFSPFLCHHWWEWKKKVMGIMRMAQKCQLWTTLLLDYLFLANSFYLLLLFFSIILLAFYSLRKEANAQSQWFSLVWHICHMCVTYWVTI